jgi:hypothetical protein
MIEHISYGGWKNNVRISNGNIEVVVTLDVGPRIIRLAKIGGPNMFNEFADQLGTSGENEWRIRGGHRFWHGPEGIPRTYVLDNFPVGCEELSDLAVRVTPPAEPENSVQKQIDIVMDSKEASVRVIHRMKNIGRWPIELAPWALSVMSPGGVAIMPLSKNQPHGERPNPAYSLTFWAYTDLTDSRLTFGRKFITIDHARAKASSKWGMINEHGWVAYCVHGMLFVNRFGWDTHKVYPDNGCNFETYSDDQIMELETLGPMTKLQPDESLEHVECWKLFTQVAPVISEKDIERLVEPLVTK